MGKFLYASGSHQPPQVILSQVKNYFPSMQKAGILSSFFASSEVVIWLFELDFWAYTTLFCQWLDVSLAVPLQRFRDGE